MPANVTSPQSSEDAIELLSDDHDQLLELFDRYDALVNEEASENSRQQMAGEICSLLTVHVVLKEEMFYPAAREALGSDDAIDEATATLGSVRAMIDNIAAGDPTEPRYDDSVRVLHELFSQHVDEERSSLFPRLRASELDLEELGSELSARQEVLLTVGEDAEPA